MSKELTVVATAQLGNSIIKFYSMDEIPNSDNLIFLLDQERLGSRYAVGYNRVRDNGSAIRVIGGLFDFDMGKAKAIGWTYGLSEPEIV